MTKIQIAILCFILFVIFLFSYAYYETKRIEKRTEKYIEYLIFKNKT